MRASKRLTIMPLLLIIFISGFTTNMAQAKGLSFFKYNRLTCKTSPLNAVRSVVKGEKHPRCLKAALQALQKPKVRASIRKKLNNAPDYFINEIILFLELSLGAMENKAAERPSTKKLIAELQKDMVTYKVGEKKNKSTIPAHPTLAACQTDVKVVLQALDSPVQYSECLEAAAGAVGSYLEGKGTRLNPLVRYVDSLGAGASARFVFLIGALLGHHQANVSVLRSEFMGYLAPHNPKKYQYFSPWACANNMTILAGAAVDPSNHTDCLASGYKELSERSAQDSLMHRNELKDYSQDQNRALVEYLRVKLGKTKAAPAKLKQLRALVLSVSQGQKVRTSMAALDLAGHDKKSKKVDPHEELFIAGIGSIAMTHKEIDTLEKRVTDAKDKAFIKKYFSKRVVVPVRSKHQGGVFGALGAFGKQKFWKHVGTGMWYSQHACSSNIYTAISAATVSEEMQPQCLTTAISATKNPKTELGSDFKKLPAGLQNIVVSVFELGLKNNGKGYPMRSINQLRREISSYIKD